MKFPFQLPSLISLGARASLSAISLVLLLAAFSVASAQEYAEMKQWESFDFASKRISAADVAKVKAENLQLMRGVVFGKHGRVFKDWEIKTYLQSRDWYKPNPNFTNSALNDTERDNLDVIRIAEAEHHGTVQPGDMRLYQNRLLTRRKLGTHTNAEWTVLAAEIEAIHGKRFDDQPWLQQYFEERYWYKAANNYKPNLSAIEEKNLRLIDTIRRQQRRVALQPGDMELFENKLINEAMLRGLSLHELRLLRNEIYARHGRVFKTLWLQQYFGSQMWYDANESFKDEEMSGPDKTNVGTIVAYENKLHNQLSTKPITRALLQGLFIEDVRKMRDEIYARRGKTFTNRWTQKYFESLDWYKADPKFSDASLTPIEKRNVATIAAYEKKAVSALDVIEG
ncbi:MAG TPA: YARHG domain-containing protein [Pyrinomonadaceae bacterium]|nr:YARHG domain-containing protein [Pyrinomonadaceae bacterium]